MQLNRPQRRFTPNVTGIIIANTIVILIYITTMTTSIVWNAGLINTNSTITPRPPTPPTTKTTKLHSVTEHHNHWTITWLTKDNELIKRHLNNDEEVHIFLDNPPNTITMDETITYGPDGTYIIPTRLIHLHLPKPQE